MCVLPRSPSPAGRSARWRYTPGCPREAGAVDPRRARGRADRRASTRPQTTRPGGGGRRRGGRGRRRRTRDDRHDGDRESGQLARRGVWPPAEDARDIAPAAALNLARGALREEARLVGERTQPALHEVGAEVVEQQESGKQEEGDDQQRRNEADEDIRQDQLAADAPEQTALRGDQQAEDEVCPRRPPARRWPPCR